MNHLFKEKKRFVLQRLQYLALHHNRDYYISMIPIVEMLEFYELDILESYRWTIDEEYCKLFHSKKAFEPLGHRIASLL